MMTHRLQIRVSKAPNPEAMLSAREIRPSKRMLRAIFGTSRPKHRMAVLLPGSEATSVEVNLANTNTDDDLMALADAVGGARRGGDVR